ncbi:TIGR01212 family radical SAM protein [Celerinatantimonas sp. YJH-8]
MLSSELKSRFGGRVRKLTIDGAFTCPNRDGTLGKGGCTFCNVDSFVDRAPSASIQEQLQQRKAELKHQHIRYLAYFQAYTSTYGEFQQLKALYHQALAQPDVVGLCVGTRPDCVSDEILALLSDYQMQGKEVWLELGLQSAHDRTLKRINRGHDFRCYQDAVLRAHRFGIKVCTHLILGLPGEHQEAYRQTLSRVIDCGVEGLKLHPLHVVQGSTLAKAWKAGRLPVMTQAEYVVAACDLIQRTPYEVVFHRVSATARPPTLLAPDWCQLHFPPLTAIAKYLSLTGSQGSRCFSS